MLAKQVRKYFWDIDISKAKPKSHPTYYILRILEMGDERAFDWLKRVYGLKTIQKTLPKIKLSKKTQNYWNFYYNSHE